MPKTEKLLVLCVDRDNDIGAKTSHKKGPIIGKEVVLKVANELGLSDPADSDFNALFQTVKMFEELKRQQKAEIAVLIGDRDVGIKSDRIIANQLGSVLKKFHADYAVVISDGSEDEHVIPIIQSKIPILSVHRVIVKQSEKLESTYYQIKDFLKESIENPKISRVVFGIPAIILLLLGIFGLEGFRFVIFVLGIYLLIKGFKLEDLVLAAFNELKESLFERKLAFFTYILGIAFSALATFRGYNEALNQFSVGIFEGVAAFVAAAVFFYFIGGTAAWLGRAIYLEKRGRKIIAIPLLGFAVSLVVYTTTQLILDPNLPVINFILSIAAGFIMIFFAIFLEYKS